MRIGLPSKPFRGYRIADKGGSGGYGASRDGGKRWHTGCDILALAGDAALIPIDGRVERTILAYPDSDLRGYVVEGRGRYQGIRVKVLYVKADIGVGQIVSRGEEVGTVQSVESYYAGKGVAVPNHVHFEVWAAMDPKHYLDLGPETETVAA
jgi:murein DD-endopeptidase MepM/ murein hydrolase activator NlpD